MKHEVRNGAAVKDHALIEALLAAAPALLTGALIIAYMLFGSAARAGIS